MSKKETKHTPARLIKSAALAGYQKDFAAAILAEKEYTVAEAKAALDAVLKKGE